MLFGQLQAAGVGGRRGGRQQRLEQRDELPGLRDERLRHRRHDRHRRPGIASPTRAPACAGGHPACSIDAPVPTGDNHGFKDGTSMAAPHVAGAFALLRECVDGNGVPQTNAAAAADLDATGVNVTRNGVTRKRINVLDAATRNVNNNDFANAGDVARHRSVQRLRLQGLLGQRARRAGAVQHRQRHLVELDSDGDRDGDHLHRGQRHQRHHVRHHARGLHRQHARAPCRPSPPTTTAAPGTRSPVTFPVNGGTTYRIKVDGFGAANGLLNLHMQNDPPPHLLRRRTPPWSAPRATTSSTARPATT